MSGRAGVWAARLTAVLVAAPALAGCGGSSAKPAAPGPHRRREAAAPSRATTAAVAAPAGVRAGTAPQTSGALWVLAGNARVRTVNELSLVSGRQSRAVGVSNAAQTLAQSTAGALALGLGRGATGAVELLASSGKVSDTVAVGAPVIAMAYGNDGSTLYVLDGIAASRTLTVIDTVRRKIIRTLAMPSATSAVVPTPGQQAIWSVNAAGQVQETSLTSDRPIESFSDGGSPGIALALSPRGGRLYVLKGTAAASNVAVIDTGTTQVRRVLPGAAHSVGLATSLDGSQLYDFVGAAKVSNVQIIDL